MAEKPPISHNREDYSRSMQISMGAIADTLWGGDLDAAWADIFQKLEEEVARDAQPRPKPSEPPTEAQWEALRRSYNGTV